MKKRLFNFISAVMAVMAFNNVMLAQFEGSIEFKKESPTDTTVYIYYVKGNRVRIDEIGLKSHTVDGTFLVDLESKTMKSLNHDRKLYLDQSTPEEPVMKGTCEVKKGQSGKNIQGYKCTEYTVTNTTENTRITYFIAEGRFAFFDKLLHLLNRRDRSAVYYLQIQDIKNEFPMLSIQTDLSGKETGRLEVTKIMKKDIDQAMFEIPKGYSKFDK